MKKIVFLSLLFSYNFFLSCLGISQKYNFDSISPNPYYRNISDGELIIYNQTEWYTNDPSKYRIKIKIFTSGYYYNGYNKYSPIARYGIENNQVNITGIEFILDFSYSGNNFFKIGNFDQTGSGNNHFAYGYGLYKIEFWKESIVLSNDFDSLVNYCYLDWRDELFDYIGYINTFDIRIDFFADSIITFRHFPYNGNYPHYYYHINDVDRHIKMWELHGTFLTGFEHRLGLFSSTDTNYNYLKWPINANKYNGNIGHENPGDLGMNLVINHYITTQDTLQENPMNIFTAKNGFLKIASGKTFDMITAVNGSNNLIVQDSSVLTLQSNSHLIIGASNKLTLKRYGKISMSPNAEILVKTGGLFCNEGGSIRGGFITFEKTHVYCSQLADSPFGDSTKVILLDSAVLEIPDSTTLHFTGKESRLVMNPHSKLKMGIGSKIIFDSSSSIYADGAEFSSVDSLEKWEGIFLYDSDADTIRNCTFSNAKTALTIINDPDDAESVYKNRIITDNTFNIPSGGAFMGIYGENNYRILLQKNDFNMPVYYPSGSPVQLLYTGVYLKNSSSALPDSSDVETNQTTNYSLNIEGNSFSNGCASLILANFTSSYLPYLIKNNTFNNTASVNLIGINISGTICYNNFTSDYVPLGIHLVSSSPNLYKNSIRSSDVGLHLSGQFESSIKNLSSPHACRLHFNC